ncbi:unnamed protein product [Miscanthus lutarioriparius]|uniref:Uncharacterized protein n=1 Tax=Miscanthus lutarioriparius TaxID=422564 RepID=A0A811QZW8_9POAL|nr:unnamed protein product [Miscanthus lutarioriparius]
MEGLDTSESGNGPGVRHVLKLSKAADEDYYVVGVGWYDVRNWRRIDHGHLFGAKTFFDARKKRRVLGVGGRDGQPLRRRRQGLDGHPDVPESAVAGRRREAAGAVAGGGDRDAAEGASRAAGSESCSGRSSQ